MTDSGFQEPPHKKINGKWLGNGTRRLKATMPNRFSVLLIILLMKMEEKQENEQKPGSRK